MQDVDAIKGAPIQNFANWRRIDHSELTFTETDPYLLTLTETRLKGNPSKLLFSSTCFTTLINLFIILT